MPSRLYLKRGFPLFDIISFIFLWFSDNILGYIKNPKKSKFPRFLLLVPNYLLGLAVIFPIIPGVSTDVSSKQVIASLIIASILLWPAVHFTRIIFRKRSVSWRFFFACHNADFFASFHTSIINCDDSLIAMNLILLYAKAVSAVVYKKITLGDVDRALKQIRQATIINHTFHLCHFSAFRCVDLALRYKDSKNCPSHPCPYFDYLKLLTLRTRSKNKTATIVRPKKVWHWH